MSTTAIIPKRGGMYIIYGLLMGGSELTNDYIIKSTTPYKLTIPLRISKQLSSSERILISARQNASSIIFKRNLETPLTAPTSMIRTDSL